MQDLTPNCCRIADHGMKVVEGILRVDGESDKEVEKRCQEYGKKLVRQIEK